MTAETQALEFTADEDPFVVKHGGFYRRWLSMIEDVDELRSLVASLEGTTQDKWIPVWSAAGRRHEAEGDRLAEAGEDLDARREYLQAKTFYAIGRFPGEITAEKRAISDDCARAYRKASRYLDPPLEVVEIPCEGKTIRAHFRAPRGSIDAPVAAVLVMCGADVFKEDRGWAGEMAMAEGLATLVMDGPGTGETPFPYEPESVKAWIAAIEHLAGRPEVDADRIGALGISRGGYSVMQLAGTHPEMVKAVVAIAGHPFGYRMSDGELAEFVEARNRRSEFRYGEPDGPPSFPPTTAEKELESFSRWALSELGLVDRITMPVLMINGKHDHLAPIGNIYYMLETGPVTGKEARVYADAGHCAFKHYQEWAPASFAWLRDKLTG
ncbi:MAG TPA: alpha/beta hydrolase [Acidimicrobiia bacterium]|jgi:dienelactone hydrolase